MQKYFNTVANRTGIVQEAATVTVTTLAGGVAALYSDNGVTPLASNVLTTDGNGYFEFYAADGRYSLTITGSNINTMVISDVLLEDAADGSTPLTAETNARIAADAVLASADASAAATLFAQGGAALIGNTPAGTIAAVTVQAALNELDTDKAALSDLAAGTGAALIGNTPAGTIEAVTVQTAIDEIVSDLAATTGASLVGNAAAGDIVATTVQDAINELDTEKASLTDLAASGGSALVGYLPAGTGAVAATVQSKLRESVSVKDFGAVGDGVTDDTAAIQAAVTAARHVYFPVGIYKTSSTITVTKTCRLSGAVSSFADTTSGAVISYAGTGAAVSITPVTKIYNSVVENLVIQAAGTALTSATAIGLLLTSSNYGVFQNVVVREFGSGIGIKVTATVGSIGAYNHFIGCMLWGNKTGFSINGVATGSADYASVILGGTVIGTGVAGSVGLIVDQYAAEMTVYGTDFETCDVCIDLYGNSITSGGGVKLIGTRTEFQTTASVRVNANTIATQLIGHTFSSGGVSTWLVDNGTRTFRTDPNANIRLNSASLEILNNIPIVAQETGGITRQILNMAANNTVQFGSSVNGNYGLGTWNFNTLYASGASGPTGYQAPFWMGTHALWVDSTGDLRIKNVAPTSDTDGAVVGTQT